MRREGTMSMPWGRFEVDDVRGFDHVVGEGTSVAVVAEAIAVKKTTHQ